MSNIMRISIPRIYLGTMTFGWNQASQKVDEPIALEMMERFINYNKQHHQTEIHYIDTARIYAGGSTETILGSTLPLLEQKMESSSSSPLRLRIGTKAHPSQPMGLSSKGIKQQLEMSLSAMNVDCVDEFYLHQPDTEHALYESLETTQELIDSGLISTIGMSNFHVSEMERAFQICDKHGWTKPSVYQGLYNPLNRLVEQDLIPILRKYDCAFVAYNPLAAGLLTGKHQRQCQRDDDDDDNDDNDNDDNDNDDIKNVQNVRKGRFKDNPNYLPRFYTPANFDGLHLIQMACDQENISIVEATFRWLLCHSILQPQTRDGILLGASSLSQLDQNLSCCKSAAASGPLPDTILKAFEEAWDITQQSAFPYWRSYSSDMPNRDQLDHGASYSANKVKT